MNRRLVAAVIVFLAACQPPGSEGPATVGPPSEPPVSEAPASAAAGCVPGAVCNGPLPAGDYLSEGTGARIEFTLDDHGWIGIRETEEVGFGLILADVDDAAISALAFGGEYFTDACDPSRGTSTTGTTPAEFMAMLGAQTGIAESDPVEVEVGGRPALQVDLTTVIQPDCEVTGDPQLWIWTLPVSGPFAFSDQEMARVIAVDGGSATVILVAEARSGVEDYEHFLEHFGEVVESMLITPLPGDG
jgi:hypothetical protein